MAVSSAERFAKRSRIWTWVLVLLFVVLFAAGSLLITAFLGLLFFQQQVPVVMAVGAAVAVVVALVALLSTYLIGTQQALAHYRARPVRKDELPELRKIAEDLAVLYEMPQPALWWSEVAELNAFATGRDSAHAVVLMMRDTYELLSKDELRAVLAHEFAHVKNVDLRVKLFVDLLTRSVLNAMRRLLALQKALTLAALSALWDVTRGVLGLRRERIVVASNGMRLKVEEDYTTEGLVMTLTRCVLTSSAAVLLLPVTIAAAVVFGVGWLVTHAVSRQREYLADATAVRLTGDPARLADALERLSAEHWARLAGAGPRQMPPGFGASCFTSETRGWFLERFGASHPEQTDRVRRLRKLALELAAPPATA